MQHFAPVVDSITIKDQVFLLNTLLIIQVRIILIVPKGGSDSAIDNMKLIL